MVKLRPFSRMWQLEREVSGHPRLVPLIGYSFDGPWMFLVAEFMPNDSLGNHLFKATKRKTMEWSMRLRVAYYIAEALEYCINEGRALYFDLNPNKVLFDEAGNPCLSCFGLVKNHRDARCYSTNIAYRPPLSTVGLITCESMIYSFGLLLRDLLTGKQISEEQALDISLGKKLPMLLDPRLMGKYPRNQSSDVVLLAEHCMQYDPGNRPTIQEVVAALAQVLSDDVGPSPTIKGDSKKPIKFSCFPSGRKRDN
ncbi:serine/threonine-protein kinase BSK1-like [Dioscorea cayenensis subsp. rotundata]|uniref:Serine/threonine-protein kinase BSK1-like n=1 Tax=Dioscorea cayennensis subsp. rotundata TaxID=55577 RepID=A0AB40C813_DIOCR|nr:serine/threonine-protein kinase BSK1-like [Dioscorea cayenensis subsp. rotundata]